jgi:hypothetical protein
MRVPHLNFSFALAFSAGVFFSMHGGLLVCLVFADAFGEAAVAGVEGREAVGWLFGALTVEGVVVGAKGGVGRML